LMVSKSPLHVPTIITLISFIAVSKAYEMFNDEEKYAYCKGVVEEAQALVDHKLEEKREQAKKEGKTSIEEDDPDKVSHVNTVSKNSHHPSNTTIYF